MTTIVPEYTDDTYMNGLLLRRKQDAHKGDFGKLLIFAGSPGMAGAAVLNGRAALKSGAGLVQYLLPDFDGPLLQILQISVPEATCVPFSAGFSFSAYSAISCGSGLGSSPSAVRILTQILDQYSGTLILDADALNRIAEDGTLKKHLLASSASVIITPHIGEAKRLLHSTAPISDPESRIRAACQLAEEYHCIAVLKGAGTLVAVKNENLPTAGSSSFSVFQNTTGNPGMATAGSGDSLAGLTASLAAQGYAPLTCARAGVFIHGKAGDLAAREFGEMGMTASDIVTHIPYALKSYYDNAKY